MSGRYKKISSGFGAGTYWKRATGQEVFRFIFYLAIPVVSSVFYADPDFMHRLIIRLKYVEYPKSTSFKSSPEQLEILRQSIEELDQGKK